MNDGDEAHEPSDRAPHQIAHAIADLECARRRRG
jgi:hypothetical protein